ncbi:hypothetical protein BHM03_00057663 [Ensete ventricosum]|nr:hypothetical protein BHM03_00057663 [Ensete ventricosum]
MVDRGPCALARPRSSQCRGGAWSDGKSLRVRLGRLAAGVVELRSSGNVSARVGRRFLQEGQVGSRRDPFNGQVSFVVDFAIPPLRRGVGAFIAMVTGYPYLKLLSSLLLTIPLHLTTPSVVLSVRRAPVAGGCRPCPPYLC